MIDGGSSVPRRQLGRYLKQAREEAGISLEAAATELEWSRAKMYRIEGGQAAVRTHDVIAMCGVYGAAPELKQALVALAKESKSRGWWHAYGDVIPAWFELYVGLEAATSGMRQYEMALVPGLLQTPEYAAAVFRTKRGITDTEVAQAVALRMERKKLLARRRPRPPRLDVILDEAVLRRPLPGREWMSAQLSQLLKDSEADGVTLRVLPSDAGAHGSVAGGFVIMDFPSQGTRPSEPTTVYVEGLTGSLYLDKPAEVTVYCDVWQTLGELALNERESQELIATVSKEFYDA